MTTTEFGSLTPRYRVILAIAKSDLTQEQVAKQMGVSPPTVSAWVKGRRIPTLPQLAKLVEVVGQRELLLDYSDADLTDLHDPSSGWMWETAGQAA